MSGALDGNGGRCERSATPPLRARAAERGSVRRIVVSHRAADALRARAVVLAVDVHTYRM